MYFELVIISKNKKIGNRFKDISYYIISDNNYRFINEYKIEHNNEIIDFDYLVFDEAIDNKRLLMDDDFYVTNQYLETNIDNYFAVDEINTSDKSLDDQISSIIDYLKGDI